MGYSGGVIHPLQAIPAFPVALFAGARSNATYLNGRGNIAPAEAEQLNFAAADNIDMAA